MSTNCNTKICRFFCEKCAYHTNKKSRYENHLLTAKHIYATTISSGALKICKSYTCDICSKSFNERTGMWRHKKKCVLPTIPQEESTPSQHDMQLPTIPTTLIFELIKQNQEFKQMLFDQSKLVAEQNKQLYEKHEENIDLQRQLLEVAKNQGSNNNNTLSNNNNNNKTFNLQFFLNETCKDAMNMKDFIQSLEMSLPELEKMGEVGFAEGMSRLFVDRLNKLDITKRPIHCSDVKREIIHIKDDNKWERDNANLDRLRKIIKQLTIKNILRVEDWKKANQGCTEYNSRKNEQYLRINMEAIGPVDDVEVKRDFGKIIRRVAENTAIDKKYLLA